MRGPAGTIQLDADLRFKGLIRVRPNAIFSGDHEIIVDPDSKFIADHDKSIGVSLRNEGFVAPGTNPRNIPPPFDTVIAPEFDGNTFQVNYLSNSVELEVVEIPDEILVDGFEG